jgi:hypothetical protein
MANDYTVKSPYEDRRVGRVFQAKRIACEMPWGRKKPDRLKQLKIDSENEA